MTGQLIVRPARPDDCTAILAMMRELARFEGYESEFRVTEKALHDGLFEQRQFHVLTASREGAVVGLLTYYFLPFTYDLSPWIYIKELYADKNYRSQGVGSALMKQLAAICRENGGSKFAGMYSPITIRRKCFISHWAPVANSDGSFSVSTKIAWRTCKAIFGQPRSPLLPQYPKAHPTFTPGSNIRYFSRASCSRFDPCLWFRPNHFTRSLRDENQDHSHQHQREF